MEGEYAAGGGVGREGEGGGGSESPVSDTQSGEYHYLKALRYIEASAYHPDGSDDDDDDKHHCRYLHCPSAGDEMDDDDDDDRDVHFTTGFRPGLALDSLQHGGCRIPHSSSFSQYSASPPSCSSSFSSPPSSGMKSESSSGAGGSNPLSRKSSSQLKRKLSDGHVHWADEFQKDLTRCHPRKSYARHPALHAPQVRPILKASPDDWDCS